MPAAQATESGIHPSYRKTAGSEPLPGYTLLSPLGRGGFGEVWKCVAPGGLHKAIKFVASESEDGRGGERFSQELAAFEQIKAIRHPFLLTLERVEQIGGELIMVMELADQQLHDRFRECLNCGLPGIPRDELLAYFADAAEALDMISGKFNLQHLDVKPANLFIVSGHVKVGDYGLVAQLEGPDAGNRGLTPRYVAPEVLHGTPSSYSDQYSLALVYQELLTGGFPYSGRTPQQLMLQHVSAQPNLSGLPPIDRPVVAKALAKTPEERYPSCLAFVQALMVAEAATAIPNVGMNIRRSRVGRSVAEMNLLGLDGQEDDSPSNPSSVSEGNKATQPVATGQTRQADEPAKTFTLPLKTEPTIPGGLKIPLPPLVSGNKKPPGEGARLSTGAIHLPPPAATVSFEVPPPPAEEVEAGYVVLDAIRSIVPVGQLLGTGSGKRAIDSQSFVDAVMSAAANGGYVPHIPGDVGRLADGGWVCQFPSTVPDSVVPLKLTVVNERWGVSVEPGPGKVVLRRVAGGGGFFGGKKYGFEATILLPTRAKAVGEMMVVCKLFGNPDQKFTRESVDLMPKLLADIRDQLANVQDRRKHLRVACSLALNLYPVHSDGSIDDAVQARCRDVSFGGVGFITPMPLKTKYVYVVFPDIPSIGEQAALVRLKRVKSSPRECTYGAQYRSDL